jgi:hypothetical protein
MKPKRKHGCILNTTDAVIKCDGHRTRLTTQSDDVQPGSDSWNDRRWVNGLVTGTPT